MRLEELKANFLQGNTPNSQRYYFVKNIKIDPTPECLRYKIIFDTLEKIQTLLQNGTLEMEWRPLQKPKGLKSILSFFSSIIHLLILFFFFLSNYSYSWSSISSLFPSNFWKQSSTIWWIQLVITSSISKS